MTNIEQMAQDLKQNNMDITKNLKIVAQEIREIRVNFSLYHQKGVRYKDFREKVDNILQVDFTTHKDFDNVFYITLFNHDQSTIDNVLLDVDFVLTEMLNEKNK